jgi:hypothetical protein
MRLIVVLFALLLVCSFVLGAVPLLPQDEEGVRGAFLTSRPKEKPASANPDAPAAKPSRRRPKSTVAANTSKTQSGSPSSNPNTNKGTTSNSRPTAVNVQRIGLGLTLFMRDANGLAIRTDPDHVFHKGDRVRVLLETNADGYLYIFNTTNDGPPILIYPDAQLDEAGNYLQAHVPFEIPSSLADQERLRWLMFDEYAGAEKLFFVFSREPLKGVPIEDELIAYCKESAASCPVRPSTEVWAAVQKEMKEPLETDKAARYGRAQTASEQTASTRGLGLSKEDPPPSLIMMASSTSSTLVTTLDLVHK